MTQPTLPALQDSLLDDDTLAALFADLAALTEIQAVMVKGAGAREAAQAGRELDTARTALAAGAAVQLRYHHDGKDWSDTLIPQSQGTRIVRICLDEVRAQNQAESASS